MLDGVPRIDGRSLLRGGDHTVRKVLDALERYSCCVVSDVAAACSAWPALLELARDVHGANSGVRYRAWRRLHGTWRGYEPGHATATEIAADVDVAAGFTAVPANRRFSSFDIGPPWPTANGADSGGVFDGPQPWPDINGFADRASGLFATAHSFAVDVARRLLEAIPEAVVPSFDAPCSTLRLLRYETTTERRSGAHVDVELLTLVASDQPGLEVMDPDGRWRCPEVGERDLVLMSGRALHATSRGAIAAPVHRVGGSTAARHSVVLLLGVEFALELPARTPGVSMPFGQQVEGMYVNMAPHLRSRYADGDLTLPYVPEETEPFKREPRAAAT